MSDHTYLKLQNQIEVSKDAELHLKNLYNNSTRCKDIAD